MTISFSTPPSLYMLNAELPTNGEREPLSMMVAALARKDSYTQRHVQRVAIYAGRLARRLGLSDMEAGEVALGGYLHDLGKLALSDQLFSLCKSELTEAMWHEVFYHPLIGAALLMQTHGEGTVHDAVLYHHERLDGSGYPFGLIDGQIPLSATVVSVADCFDAITTDRPYQKRKDSAQALQILKEMAGSFLDRHIVDTFIEDISQSGMVHL